MVSGRIYDAPGAIKVTGSWGGLPPAEPAQTTSISSAVMRVAFGADPGAARPEKLFEADYVRSIGEKAWDVAPDGRFLMKKVLKADYTVNVLLNWAEELKRLAPPK